MRAAVSVLNRQLIGTGDVNFFIRPAFNVSHTARTGIYRLGWNAISFRTPDDVTIWVTGSTWCAGAGIMNIYITVPATYRFKRNCGVCGTWKQRNNTGT